MRLRCAEVLDDGKIFARVFGDDVGLTGGHGFRIHEVGADSEGEGSGVEEGGGGGEGDSSGGDHFDLGEGALERGEIAGSSESSGGEDFDDVGSGFPRGKDFGGGEGSGEDGDGVAVAHLDGLEIKGGADDELGSFEDAGAGGFGVEDGAGADEDVGALLDEAADDL